jgi:hypothetical protein
MLTETASETVDRVQWNVCSSGRNSTPGVARTAAAESRTKNVTARAIQAGWIPLLVVELERSMSQQSVLVRASSEAWPVVQLLLTPIPTLLGRVRAERG